jgi:hypothetical protein
MTRLAGIMIVLAAAFGCATKIELVTYDFSQRSGLYILGYTLDANLRRRMEDTLVEDLQEHDLIGYVSYIDLPDPLATDRQQVIAAANAKDAIGVLVINEVVPGEDELIENPNRISPEHPDLKAFYDYTKSVAQPRDSSQPSDSSQPAFAEANAFVLQGDSAKLVWSGTTWSFRADGKGSAIPDVSKQIADELLKAGNALRPTKQLE